MPLQRCWDNFFTKGETGIRKQLEAVKWLELIALTKPFEAEGNKVEICCYMQKGLVQLNKM